MQSTTSPCQNPAGPPETPAPSDASEGAHAIMTESADALLVVDEADLVQYANPAAAALFGRDAAELAGRPFGYTLPPGGPADIEIIRPDGGVRIVEVSVGRIAWRGARASLASLRDVTDRRQAELMLLHSQQILRAAIDSLSVGILILDAAGGVLAANRAWSELSLSAHGPELHARIAANFLEACRRAGPHHGASRPPAAEIAAVLDGRRQRYTGEYAVEHPAGRRWFAISVASCGEGWARAVITNEEITARRRQEALEADKRQLLELVVRHGGLEPIVGRLLAMAADRYPDLLYGALDLRGAGLFRSLALGRGVPHLPALDAWAKALAAAPPADAAAAPSIAPAPTPALRPAADGRRAGIAACWRASFSAAAHGGPGLLILCRGAEARPADEDLAFVELVGQLMAIALEQHERTRLLAHQAHHDALTGLPNRLLFEDRLSHALQAARRGGHMLAVLFIDLDRFKQINDTLGHSVGDTLLVQLARRFEGSVRASDTLARRGGDEFMLVLPEVAGSQHVAQVAHRLHDQLRRPFVVDGHELYVSASIGASLFPNDGEDADTLQRNADAAMYRAKSTLRNSFQFFDASVNRAALERLTLETHLRRAVERGELSIHYQPKLDRRGRLAGAEALLRWRHPTLGPIPPASFIPLAEELGLIVPIGEWCLAEICGQARHWQRRGLPPLRIAANVSALQFAQPGFIPAVERALAQSALDPAWLELELTESMLMGDVAAVSRQIGRLRELGLTLAIDDFGTGFSSLAYLQRLPIGVLKIDRSFVSRLGQPGDEGDRAIVSAIVTLGHHLHMELVAEGVETAAQHAFLHDLGCDLFQGYLFSEPLPAPLFEQLLRGERPPGAARRG